MRLARPTDAQFILSLRTDESLAMFLSKTEGGVDSQRHWLEQYIKREQAGEEFYFIITRLDTDTDCGTVRLYDFRDDSFCWGSWVLGANKTPTAALESALLVYDFAFNTLGFRRTHFDVMLANRAVIKFHKRFGARETRRDESNQYFEMAREQFEEKRGRVWGVVERSTTRR